VRIAARQRRGRYPRGTEGLAVNMSVLARDKTSTFPPAAASRTRPGAGFFSMKKTTSLTLALLAVIAAVAGSGILGVLRAAPLREQCVAWSACGMLVILAIVILLIGRTTTLRSLGIIEQQLRELTRNDDLNPPGAPMPQDLRPVMCALFEYVNHVRASMDELRLQKKELDVQMRVAEAERQNTEAIIFSISDAVLVLNSFGELVLANTAAEELFGFHAKQWRHRPIDRVLNDASLACLIKDARTIGEHSVRRHLEYSTLRDGRTQTFNITLSTVVDNHGQSRGIVAVFHDITHERESAQVKSDFVSAVSHELRTPLSSIKAYVEMLVDGEAHDENTRRHFYQIIESETDRLQRLINNILNISKIESGVVEVNHQMIHANQVVRDVVATIMPQASGKNLQIESDLDESLPTIWADRDMLHQAVLNVLSNAIKYTPAGGRIQVSTAAAEDHRHIVITVRDNGMGIRAQDLPRIFDKFYRSADGAAIAKGTGLGLNLVKHIVETVHKGRIAVASEPGAGTSMVLRFPRVAI